MNFLFLLIAVSVVGIGMILWLLRSESNESEPEDIKPLTPEQLKGIDAFSNKLTAPETKKEDAQKKEQPLKEESIQSAQKNTNENFLKKEPLAKKQKKSVFSKLSVPKLSIPKLSFPKKRPKEEKPLSLGPKKESIVIKLLDSIKNIFRKMSVSKKKKTSSSALLSLKEKLEMNIDPFSDITENNPFPQMDKNMKEEETPPQETDSKSTPKIDEKMTELNEDKKIAEPETKDKILNENAKNLEATVSNLKEKYNNLESLYNEKSVKLDKLKAVYESELNNRKEFNKVKDILEKELKDLKDKTKNIQTEFNAVTLEKESLKKRVNQLEGKLAKSDNDLQEKNKTAEGLSSQLKENGATMNPEDHPEEQKIKETEPQQDPSPAPAPQDPVKKPEEKNILDSKSKDVETGSFIEKMLMGGDSESTNKDKGTDQKDTSDKDKKA